MKISIGRVVVVRGVSSNGSNEHPALVNRAWADHDTIDGPVLANLTVFPDMGAPKCLGSVTVYDALAEAMAAQARHRATWEAIPPNERSDFAPLIVAHWPELV